MRQQSVKGKGKLSFLLAIIRHIVLIIPLALLMNSLFGLNGLILSQPIADAINTLVSVALLISVMGKIKNNEQSKRSEN